jgi:hypothetical protein
MQRQPDCVCNIAQISAEVSALVLVPSGPVLSSGCEIRHTPDVRLVRLVEPVVQLQIVNRYRRRRVSETSNPVAQLHLHISTLCRPVIVSARISPRPKLARGHIVGKRWGLTSARTVNCSEHRAPSEHCSSHALTLRPKVQHCRMVEPRRQLFHLKVYPRYVCCRPMSRRRYRWGRSWRWLWTRTTCHAACDVSDPVAASANSGFRIAKVLIPAPYAVHITDSSYLTRNLVCLHCSRL